MDDGVGVGRVVEDLHMTSAPMSCDQGSFPTWAGIITGELINTAQYQNRKKILELTACKILPIRHRAHLIESRAVNPAKPRHGQCF
jgi:hypothetical protein